MSEYKIEAHANGASLHHYVYKALGPWPLKNWSWSPHYSSESRAACEQWITDTQFAESPEGQRLAAVAEQKKADRYAAQLREREAMAAEGWLWQEARMFYVHIKSGEVRTSKFAR